MFFPVNQTLDYAYPVFRSFAAAPVLTSIAVLTGLFTLTCVLVVRAVRDPRTFALPAFGMTLFFLAHSVESSFVSIPEIISEHRMYLPLAGFLVAAIPSASAMAFRSWDRKKAVRRVLAGTLVLGTLFSAATLARNALWDDPAAFWEDAVSKAPDNWRALTYLGEAYMGRHEYARAATVLERASRNITTRRLATASTYVSLGQAYMKLNAYDKALASYEKAVATFPSADNILQLAEAQWESGLRDQAKATANGSLNMNPRNPAAHNALGLMLAFDEQYDGAFAAFERAITLDPSYDTARYNRALAHLEAGNLRSAEEDYRTLREMGSPFSTPLEEALRQFKR
jgi:tetratricopeptide (TPR) repeat protein